MLSPYLIIPYEENATTVYSFLVYYSKPMYHKSHKLNGIYLVWGGVHVYSCMSVCMRVCTCGGHRTTSNIILQNPGVICLVY